MERIKLKEDKAQKSLQNKLLSVLVICLVTVLLFIISNNFFIAKFSENNKKEFLDEADKQITRLYTSQKEVFDNIARSIANSEILTEYVGNGYYYNDVSHDNSDIFNYLGLVSDMNEYIDHIMIYDYAFEYLLNEKNDISVYIDMGKFPWFVQYVTGLKPSADLDKYCMWHIYNEYVSITYKADVLNPLLMRRTFITLNINKTDFIRFLDGLSLTDNSKNAIFSKDDLFLFIDGDDMLQSKMRAETQRNFDSLSNKERVTLEHNYLWYYIQYGTLDFQYDIGIVYLIPDKDITTDVYEYTIILSIGVSLLILIICYAVMRGILNANIQKPISQLIRGMEKVGNGDFTFKLDDSICRDNEIKGLFCAYNSMTDRVTVLIEELYQAELYRKQLELQALQDKIDPHFLYNTLDTINWTAKEHNVDEISKIVIALSTMYRKIFNKGKDLTTIKDALEGISCYLEIQRIRYGESFSYEIFCPPELKECVILNLIIQTVVENAIIHGLEDRSSGRLEIHVTQDEVNEKEKGDIIIKVMDNGIGMTEEKLNLIMTSINSVKLESESGLRNVQKRIRLYYGMQYGLTITSRYKEGTTVILRVPYREREKDD
jgi:two-component system sensor histidine kinase YesM